MLIFFSCTFSQAIFSGYSNVNSALTLENLEGAFYAQGFSKFPDSDFMALGLQAADVTNLKSIATTEQTHVTTLTTAIAGAGFKPVQPCTYNFGFTTAAAMVATAGNLENIGVSAYVALPRQIRPHANPSAGTLEQLPWFRCLQS